MRIILVGSVESTERTLDKFIEHELNVVGVFGYESCNTSSVSGYVNLKNKAENAGYVYTGFQKINDHADEIESLNADLIFIVGLSQLVSKKIIDSASHCCIGFHPTSLPRGRGRAPIAWLVLCEERGAASFFRITEGVDDGPIISKVEFDISEDDDAKTVYSKVLDAMDSGLDTIIQQIKNHSLKFVSQNAHDASYYARRTPEDGCIDWSDSAVNIHRLVRSAARPHPGAYSFLDNQRLTIWKSSISKRNNLIGVIGRIVDSGNYGFTVQTGDGLLDITEYELEEKEKLRVGCLLGYIADLEIYNLKKRIDSLESQIRDLQK